MFAPKALCVSSEAGFCSCLRDLNPAISANQLCVAFHPGIVCAPCLLCNPGVSAFPPALNWLTMEVSQVRDATTAPPEKQVALTAVTDSALPGPLEVQWDLGGDEADGKPPTVSWDLAGVSADVVGEAPALLNWDVDIPAEPSEAGEPPTPSSDVDVDTAAAPGGQNEAPAVQWDIDVSAQDAPGVQWDVDVSAEDSPGVDWGIGLDGDGEAPAGIDWGASTGEAATAGPADEGVTSGGFDRFSSLLFRIDSLANCFAWGPLAKGILLACVAGRRAAGESLVA